MNGSANDFLQMSNGLSPRDNEDNPSMFFDFAVSAPAIAENLQTSSKIKTQEPVQRGGIRVSLACVPVSCAHPFLQTIT